MLKSQWRGVDITTFPTEQLWRWVDELKEEIKTIRAEIDRRAEEAVEGSTGRLIEEGSTGWSREVSSELTDPPTEGTEPTDRRGHPPLGTEDGG